MHYNEGHDGVRVSKTLYHFVPHYYTTYEYRPVVTGRPYGPVQEESEGSYQGFPAHGDTQHTTTYYVPPTAQQLPHEERIVYYVP